MSRASSADDFSAPDSPADADASPLRRLVLAQLEQPGGAAVQLLTTALLAAPEPYGDPALVEATARDLGLERTPAPFAPDAYLLQSALGERLLADPDRVTGSPVVALNLHELPVEHRAAFTERLRRLRDVGPVLDPDTDVTTASGPRVVVGLYDGYRDATLHAADVCHDLGLRAWVLPLFETNPDEPDVAGLSDDELADLATVHELGFHTASHARVEDLTEADLAHEVTEVHARLTAIAGRPPRTGAWLGGSRWDERHLGNRALRDLGVATLVSNWALEAVPAPHPQG